jgi:hypothetical protein
VTAGKSATPAQDTGCAVKLRIATGLLVLSLAGCASDTPFEPPMSLGAMVVTPKGSAKNTNPEFAAAKKTVASKVLSAMAFERVTGFKADPARLLETE